MTVVTVTARGTHDPRIERVGPGFKAKCSCGWTKEWITNDRIIAKGWAEDHADPQGTGQIRVKVSFAKNWKVHLWYD